MKGFKYSREELERRIQQLEKEGSELREANKRLESIQTSLQETEELAKLGHWELDLVTNTLSWSDEIYRIFDLKPQEFGASYEAFLDNIHPEDREFVNTAYSDSLKSKKQYNIIHRLLLKNGKIKYVNESCRTEYAEDGTPLRSLGVVFDVTDRHRAEEQERLSNSVFNSAAEAIMITDADEKIVSINPAFMRNTGYSENEVIGRTPRMFQSGKHDPAYYQEMWRLLSSKGHWQGEIWDRKKDGTTFLNWLSITAVKDDEGKTVQYTSLYTDISERKLLEEQLRQAQKLETIGQLAGGIAHEFNNLLTPILGHLEIVLDQTLEQPKVQESLGSAGTAARRAATLTKALLSFSRQNSPTFQVNSLSDLTGEVIHLLRQAIDRQIEIAVESDDDLWPVFIDTDQIHQVIMNLCLNARDTLKESLSKGKSFQPSIRVELKNVYLDEAFCKSHPDARVGEFVCLSVSDNGEGIKEATLPHLFEPFFTTKGIGQGTGLGLASSYGNVNSNNGWIEVKTAQGEGSTFDVYLPRTERPVEKKVKGITVRPDMDGTATIMIVDDDESVRGLGKAVLERRGYTVLLAEGGDQALELFRQERECIEIVILDLTMPRESGWEVLRRLRALDPGLKVIVSTGHDISGHTRDKGDLGTFMVLSKPFTPREMEQTIREVLDQGECL